MVAQDTVRQQDWKIDRLTKDNRALEAANMELRAKVAEVKAENLQVRLSVNSVSVTMLLSCSCQQARPGGVGHATHGIHVCSCAVTAQPYSVQLSIIKC